MLMDMCVYVFVCVLVGGVFVGVSVCVGLGEYMPWHVCGSQTTTLCNQFSPIQG